MPDTKRDSLIGASIGNYVVSGILGQGGMGTVYLAEHPDIARQVAIKVVAGQYSMHPEVVARFRDEALAVNKIKHPNIVDIYDFGIVEDGRPYFVMEMLEGETLGERITKKGRLGVGEAAPILAQTLDALSAAHQAGIIHRDLKPDNIFVQKRRDGEQVKILDFGIAKLLGDNVGSTVDGQMLGTPLYMSPEQAAGRAAEVGPASDLYSLGVILYQLFVGALPFESQSVGALVLMHTHEPPPPPRERVPDLDARLEAILLRCLEKKPAARFASAEALKQALADVLPGFGAPLQPTEAQSAVMPSVPERATPVRTWIAAISAALVIGIGGGVAVWMSQRGPEPLAASAIAPPWPGPLLDGKELKP